MIEVPEHLMWDGDTTDIRTWGSFEREHFWYNPATDIGSSCYYCILDDGRVVRITHVWASKEDADVSKEATYLGTGFPHHAKKK